MQYFLNGFRPGDPSLAVRDEDRLPEAVDVLIVGAGPAGLVLGAQLARFPGITTRIAERKSGPLRLGQADGVACRTVEMFEAFDLAEHLLKESYWVNETCFWRPSAKDRTHIERTGRIRDTPEGMSEFPHVIVNQARMLGYLLGCMRNGASGLVPSYGLEFTGLDRDEPAEYPVEVRLREVDIDMQRRVRARYVVGCDGAHSAVRAALGRELHGDRANHAWGVVDILAVTDFPDIRLKAAIQSAEAGSILLIPREGGYLVRLYVDLGVVTDANRHDLRGLTAESVVGIANRVLHPYHLDVRETAWFSIYEVAQGLTDAFDDAAGRGNEDPRVFIAGDACHTHSAQAGQGMNVSMADAFNLGWKLAAVLRGQSDPALLRTYSAERQPVAQELIDFDREWAALMATHPRDPAHPEASGTDPDTLRDYYARGQRYTMGIATRYPTGLLTGEGKHQSLAAGFPVGMRFHSAPVVRLADARRVEIGHVAKADGRWRLYLFADREESRLRALCEWLTNASDSPIRACTPAGADIDAVIDVRTVLQRPHREVEVDTLPALLLPHKGRYGLADYEKVFCARGAGDPDVYAARDIDRGTGCAVIVRPDQYVSEVLPLDDHAGIRAFLVRVLRVRARPAGNAKPTPRIEHARLPA
ncbi:MAG: FAD-dependent monooxygenase [Rhodanobacteraceae bacterium]